MASSSTWNRQPAFCNPQIRSLFLVLSVCHAFPSLSVVTPQSWLCVTRPSCFPDHCFLHSWKSVWLAWTSSHGCRAWMCLCGRSLNPLRARQALFQRSCTCPLPWRQSLQPFCLQILGRHTHESGQSSRSSTLSIWWPSRTARRTFLARFHWILLVNDQRRVLLCHCPWSLWACGIALKAVFTSSLMRFS